MNTDNKDQTMQDWRCSYLRPRIVRKRIGADNQSDADKYNNQTKPTVTTIGGLVTLDANTEAAGDHHVDDDRQVEERDLLQRHERLEARLRVLGKPLHDLGADRSHQVMERTQKDAGVEAGSAIRCCSSPAVD